MSEQQQDLPSGRCHPRRPPAHKSVSLLHSPGKRSHGETVELLSRTSSNVPSSDRANPPSPGSSKPGTKKESSGEVSDAGKWFETSNNNISQNSTSFVDNDPPFFFRNSSSSTSPDMRNPLQMHLQQQTSIPHRPALMNMRTDGSSNEDFRSVIDDLTIENKKLKRRLKKYERIHDAHLQNEKLFEVRVHGLPPDKKRELEETLRKFALELEDLTPDGDRNTSGRPQLNPHTTISSYTSTQFADSAYHSVSASGQNSNTASGGNGGQSSETKPQKMSKSQFHRHQDSIQSYLQDIPPGLMPKTIAMTETAKKKLVVRRMEQIFAGKGAVAGGHQQPMQQQEVAQSAAQADRAAIEEATGKEARVEGLREARIMYDKAENRQTTKEHVDGNGKGLDVPSLLSTRTSNSDFATSSPAGKSPDQRPTRPLDLDPQRAQIPTENLNYIRHLGFSPPDPELTPADGHGWIYLNLLVNMAQLHTINVTTDFVKKALQDYSTKLELSHDERKVRWKGGHGVSLNSSDSSPEHELEMLKHNVKKIGKKRRKLGPSSTNTSSEATGQSSENQRSNNHLAYTPLFYHKESPDEYGSGMERDSEEDASPLPAQATGNTSSGFASSGVRTSSSKRKRDDGPIIFYNKAKFCTDLSGDRGSQPARGHQNYTNYTNTPLGATPEKNRKNANLTDDERRGPLVRTALNEMDAEPPTSSDVELEFQGGMSSPVMTVTAPKGNFDFEASGIGGVVPEDNFEIDVECRRVRDENFPVAANSASHASRWATYPDKIKHALRDSDDDDDIAPSMSTKRRAPIFNGEIISTRRKHLPPSTLPPPSLLPFDSSSGDADTDMSDVSEMDDEYEESDEPPTAAPRLMNVSPDSQQLGSACSDDEDEEEEEDGKEYETDGSVDFLAQAREADPESIRAREREYDANMAERLAEEIPAGSSAATAGGGSGYNSPQSAKADDGDEIERRPGSRSSQGLQRGGSLKRSRTSESIIVHGKASRHE